ncbi:hypothetical protein QQP08_015634 [Theobroma cacao]|nr:hypothetical protein QQP08_015634 [Theobroma cacao]
MTIKKFWLGWSYLDAGEFVELYWEILKSEEMAADGHDFHLNIVYIGLILHYGQNMILKRKSEKLPGKAKAVLMKDHQMSMTILMRGVQTDDIGGGIGRRIEILILDGKRPREGLCSLPMYFQFSLRNWSNFYIAQGP